MEVWLRTNARAVWLAAVLPGTMALAGAALVFAQWNAASIGLRVVGGMLFAVGAATVAALAWQARGRRLAYADGHLLVWLRRGPPEHVPIDLVECFWLAQTPSMLPGKRQAKSEVVSVMIRLAERASDWRQRDVAPQLGTWCDGYITIRGTWCEPLSMDVVNRLNSRLAEVNRAATQA